jgi:hypothetical protein
MFITGRVFIFLYPETYDSSYELLWVIIVSVKERNVGGMAYIWDLPKTTIHAFLKWCIGISRISYIWPTRFVETVWSNAAHTVPTYNSWKIQHEGQYSCKTWNTVLTIWNAFLWRRGMWEVWPTFEIFLRRPFMLFLNDVLESWTYWSPHVAFQMISRVSCVQEYCLLCCILHELNYNYP